LNKKKWTIDSIDSQWTEKTSGGGDIDGVSWRKNPQFFIQPLKKSTICITLSQNEHSDLPMGLYVCKYTGLGRKMVSYSGDEVGRTSTFSRSQVIGLTDITLEKDTPYMILPCTKEPSLTGKFSISVYSDNDFELYEIQKKWEFVKSVKSKFTTETAGGSPNNETHYNNPQYLLSFPQKKNGEIIIEFSVTSTMADSIGFIIAKSEQAQRFDNEENPLTEESIIYKPTGWKQSKAVSHLITITDDLLNEDSNLIIIPSTFRSDVLTNFALHVFADQEIKLQLITEDGVISDEEKESDSGTPLSSNTSTPNNTPKSRKKQKGIGKTVSAARLMVDKVSKQRKEEKTKEG